MLAFLSISEDFFGAKRTVSERYASTLISVGLPVEGARPRIALIQELREEHPVPLVR
jgi:hypothetical protein